MNYKHLKTLEKSQPLKTGGILVKEGFINSSDVEMVLSIQKKQKQTPGTKKHQFFGMILCDLNLITPINNYYTLYKYGKIVSLKYYLILKNIVPPKEIKLIGDESRSSNIPFYALLVKKNIISKILLQKLLFELYHIPYRAVGSLIFDKKNKNDLTLIIKKEDSQKQLILPLAIKNNRILVGITDVENLLFIHKLDFKFPHFRFKVVFIPFSGFLWFFKLLYNMNFPTPKLSEPKHNNSPDLSLLLNFKTIISDPLKDHDKITSLYKRYELLRNLTGYEKSKNRLDYFKKFIFQHFKKICLEYKCTDIEFFLKKDEKRVNIIALPKIKIIK